MSGRERRVNLIVYLIQKYKTSDNEDHKPVLSESSNCIANKLLPPGWAIGLVWVAIFALLGWSHWLLVANGNTDVSWILVGILAICLAYPFYTMGFDMRYVQYADLASLIVIFSGAIGIATANNVPAFLCIVPLLVWLSYVNIVDAIRCIEC